MCKANQIAPDSLKSINRACEKSVDVLCIESGVQETVTAKVRAGLKTVKDVAGVLCKNSLSIMFRGLVYKMYTRSTINYGPEC